MSLNEFAQQCKNSSAPGVKMAWGRLFPAVITLLRLEITRAFYSPVDESKSNDKRAAAYGEFRAAHTYMVETCRMNGITDMPPLEPTNFAEWLLQY